MLPVLHAAPTATPTEAVGGEDLLTQVVLVDLVWEIHVAVHIIDRSRWPDTASFDARVLQGVDIDSHAKGVA